MIAQKKLADNKEVESSTPIMEKEVMKGSRRTSAEPGVEDESARGETTSKSPQRRRVSCANATSLGSPSGKAAPSLESISIVSPAQSVTAHAAKLSQDLLDSPLQRTANNQDDTTFSTAAHVSPPEAAPKESAKETTESHARGYHDNLTPSPPSFPFGDEASASSTLKVKALGRKKDPPADYDGHSVDSSKHESVHVRGKLACTGKQLDPPGGTVESFGTNRLVANDAARSSKSGDAEDLSDASVDDQDYAENSEEEEEEEVRSRDDSRTQVSKGKDAKGKLASKAKSRKSMRSKEKVEKEMEIVPVSEFKGSSSNEQGLRRSTRAKFPPLDYWRNERFILAPNNETGALGEAMGNIPIISGVAMLRTESKKRKAEAKPAAKARASRKVNADTRVTHKTSNDESLSRGHQPGKHKHAKTTRRKAKTAAPVVTEPIDDNPFDDCNFRQMHHILDGEMAFVFDKSSQSSKQDKVISLVKEMEQKPLLGGGVVREAFRVPMDKTTPAYQAGQLILPPKGVKDAETTEGSQLYTIVHSQPNAVEVIYAHPHDADSSLESSRAQRFLLDPGDRFRVPPRNRFQIQNHSEATPCRLSWTIISPIQRQERHARLDKHGR